MKPWIVLTGIALVLEIFAILWTILNLNLRMAIGGIFPGLVHAYFFLVVWSYKAEVKEGRLLQKVIFHRICFGERITLLWEPY